MSRQAVRSAIQGLRDGLRVSRLLKEFRREYCSGPDGRWPWKSRREA
jgi:hypothetical protein